MKKYLKKFNNKSISMQYHLIIHQDTYFLHFIKETKLRRKTIQINHQFKYIILIGISGKVIGI